MRPLTEQETKILFEKLANYTGNSLKDLIAPLSDAPNADRYVFRVIKDRVYYVLLSIANLATSVARDNLASVGICLGKFTKTLKFRLHITALPILAAHARYKVWVKPNGTQPFLYGGHIVKAHVGRMTDETPANVGIVVYEMNDTAIGFGVSARSSAESRKLDPTGIVVFRQADCGEYLRDEDTLFAG
ncbi:Uu.00g060550.m01.CDS01 [Anthostomella pinea]|uniref:60S ribosome subunit biogenesis protein NIP7 n=1 Tax=Anthostomella pinea TaxID=933095 RepID=A0AAI8VSA6_9PEZI|nr:Uu.00g060550.m01.CDS01 [Anthostomella pinea]